VHVGESSASACAGAREGRPDWNAGALSEADGVHGSSRELAFDEQDGVGQAGLNSVAGDELVFPCGRVWRVLAEKSAS
jgi:hypothetical protein